MKNLLLAGCLCTISAAVGAQEARLLRFPAVSGNTVVFSYAGDLYTVARSGGVARKLTNHPGYEMFPKFSHDGKTIAFTGQYDGNTEVFTIPASGGVPKRITYSATLTRDDVSDRMGPNNVVLGWSPDDKQVVFRNRGNSANPFKGQIYLAPLNGDLAKELPFSVAGWASYNEDGSKLAMNRVFREFRTWKHYKGGMADDIWLYDVKSGNSENLTNNPAQDIFPMYKGNTVYFLSDRDHTMNLFAYDINTKQTKKLTNFTEYDCKFPSLGDNAIAFENGGYIYLYDLASGQQQKLTISFSEDFLSARPKLVDGSKFVESFSVAPDGKRAVFSGRGDVFTVPEKNGVTRNLTRSSGAHDRSVAWSPDGRWISFISDRSGEDELYIQKQDGSEPAKALTKGGGSYKFYPVWSPDSKWLLLADRAQDLYYVNVTSGAKTLITHSESAEITEYSWAPDSRWIAYTQPGKSRGSDIVRVYNRETKKDIAVTDEWYDSNGASFSPDGKLLYFISQRDFNPTYSQTEWNHAYVDMSKPYYVRLTASGKSAFQQESDEVSIKEESKASDSKKASDSVVVTIEEEGLADRIESLPVNPGNYRTLVATNDGVYYASGSTRNAPSLKFYSLKDKKENDLGISGGFDISDNKKKIVFSRGGDFYLEDLGTSRIEARNELNLDGLKFITDLRAEWTQVYDESWRQMRDYFYDPNMHGVNWKKVHDRYAELLPYVNHRNDLTYLIGEMIGELNIGHAYVNSGDRPDVERIKTGMLGARFSRDKSGYYKIDSILSGESWDKSLVSPLRQPGINVKKGDYIIAINGTDVSKLSNLYEALLGQADQVIELTTNSTASASGAKKYLVKPIADESQLYYHEWVQQNIAKVTAASGGRIGYLHVPDMGPTGLNQFARYFYPQLDKEALIIDDRGNGGGNVTPMIIERLRREVSQGTMFRNGKFSSVRPTQTQIGPKVCLIDQYSASDGDLFPFTFQFHKIGPLIGQRTWGGVVGIRGSLPFIDGGDLRKPEFATFAADGSRFVIEGEGVHPDIEVIQDPHQEWLGNDQQLKRGIDELLKQLQQKGKQGVPPIPAFPDKSK
ncbi:protease [Pseudoflavitalea sp. G-6-1-2]|uniref:S41 family peptidase n=1 Tax=Pseudoflavitalea sp. G-6-1-2 TaxID=2728841 RepID=UPI00146A3F64|nr:S41 family peptidase [Pseudoflavitalea sp. G-6-1-2]NML23214.1 protease [Pseudoflavitalea sp. G-6-1-2]